LDSRLKSYFIIGKRGFNIKVEISECDRITKTVTIIAGFIFLISLMFDLFIDTNIPAVSPMALGIFSFGLGIRELNSRNCFCSDI
jgi:hypothetical protein